jgi:hypothetical protein
LCFPLSRAFGSNKETIKNHRKTTEKGTSPSFKMIGDVPLGAVYGINHFVKNEDNHENNHELNREIA